ncbi:unnamed protein product [Kuraishia capsulata CBS 1993]|uniref:TFIID subunit TAF5 NTD2 domain-containing protein n=1 Tax=Kuraishia capsulata CBS 1993 TaxID=1382522 RepID=W6MWS3_9ASCO|nr:uncharacterized protein KUCA_T00003784001 [Kuraishia capsulata CBS 1993]CDK27805.1 unnamed protein product [Kuraishia capsulata CBS 1993]
MAPIKQEGENTNMSGTSNTSQSAQQPSAGAPALQSGAPQQVNAAQAQQIRAQQAARQQQAKGQQFSQAELNRIVLEYLNKKGYHQTEAMLRVESSRLLTPQGPMQTPNNSAIAPPSAPNAQRNRLPFQQNQQHIQQQQAILRETPQAYTRAYSMLRSWCESSLDLYRYELEKILFPIFIHCYLNLIAKGDSSEAREFFNKFSKDHLILHEFEISKVAGIALKEHIDENEVAKLFRTHKYRILISKTSFNLLLYFLHENEAVGGGIVIRLLNRYIDPVIGADSFEAGSTNKEGDLNPQEGIQELYSHIDREKREGRANVDGSELDTLNSKPVKLGKMPMDPEYSKELEAELKHRDENESQAHKKVDTTLLEEYNANFKTDPNDETAPTRESIPFPAKTAVDLKHEIQVIQDSRAKIKLSAVQAALPSVCMYTFHNTNNDLTTLEFNDDCTMVAGGFQDSFIKLWSIDGSPLKSVLKNDIHNQTIDGIAVNGSRRLVGHSGAVYGLSFSPDNHYLLSSSEDKTVRLWSTDTYTSLVSYKGHNSPVWDVKFSPLGHYFATASHDQTARLWSCDHIYPLRMFAGHLHDVDCVEFHPNSSYIFTGSSDKTVRMWDVARGESVRVFMGHSGPINTIAASPDGRWLATAGEDSVINVWDIGSGRKLKTMRGHGRSSIYSLSFSKEGSVLVSGASDCSVRVWDIKKGTLDNPPEPEKYSTESNGDAVTSQTGNGASGLKRTEDQKKRTDIVGTQDHMAVYHTKRTPVYKVHFTRRNLCLAAGVFTG